MSQPEAAAKETRVRAMWITFLLLALCLPARPIAAIEISWTLIGNPGNACDMQPQGCFGTVSNYYRIGIYEVTNAEYTAFLNAVAAADPNGVYHAGMASSGITRSGDSGSYRYSAVAGRANRPVGNVTFYDALRFANWLHNGQPVGVEGPATTEDGAYTFRGATAVGARNAGARVFLPSEDEWYKAAYGTTSGTGYFGYPAGSDTPPSCAAPGTAPNRANCDKVASGDATDVGSFRGSPSARGTFDQGGNVIEWNEAVIGEDRGVRGGSYQSGAADTGAGSRFDGLPTYATAELGFRVAPEPGATQHLVVGAIALRALARRRAPRR